MSKKKVVIIFGGPSVEHEISLVSSKSIIQNIDRDLLDVLLIFISKEGKWHLAIDKNSEIEIKSGTQIVPEFSIESRGCFLEIDGGSIINRYEVDVIFPVLHGTYGEDGSIQGCFCMMGIPYVGANTLGSAIGMDKIIMKEVLKQNGLPIVNFFGFNRAQWDENGNGIINKIDKEFNYPLFVKSADLGSSVGISKVDSVEFIKGAIESSLKYSNRVIVEQAVQNTRELEISVLGNDKPIASLPGEIIPKKGFYDYDAKYHDDSTELKIPAELSSEIVGKLQDLAIKTFTSLCCNGMGRIDFLMDSKSEEFFISEINTIPGFTSVSMYPKLWEATGISYKDLIIRLIELAQEEFNDKKSIQTDFG